MTRANLILILLALSVFGITACSDDNSDQASNTGPVVENPLPNLDLDCNSPTQEKYEDCNPIKSNGN